MPDINDPLQPLEDVIRCTLLPALLKISPPNDVTRRLLALPPCWGGLGIFEPPVQCKLEYTASLDITGPLSSCIGSGEPFCQEKCCPPENFYPRTKFFSDCVENFCPTLKIFVRLVIIRSWV